MKIKNQVQVDYIRSTRDKPPETNLARAVLSCAFLDSMGYLNPQSSHGRGELAHLKESARKFISAKKEIFREWCDIADADPDWPTPMTTLRFNKPFQVLTQFTDEGKRETLADYIKIPGIYAAGRLDRDSEGLLLLTNDGDLTHRLTHPSYGVDKEYLTQVEGNPSRAAVRELRDGVELDDGVTAAARVTLVEPNLLKIVIHEGRNRQVRRMCEAVGHRVVRLVRTRIGPLTDRQLGPGEWRSLTPDELRSLEIASAGNPGR